MKSIIKENSWFYIGFAVLLTIGLVILANQNKGDLILYFAYMRHPMIDSFFSVCTKIGEEYIYVAAVLLLIFAKYRYSLIIPIIGVLVLGVSLSLKSFFGTPRPRTFFYKLFDAKEIVTVPGVDLHVGYNSFPSGHSMSAFAIFTFIALCVNRKSWSLFFLGMAALVAFSRIVITQHFLEDVLAGSTIGLLLGTLVYWGQTKVFQGPDYWFNDKFRREEKEPIA